jgi:hypothetical protein
MLFGVAAALLLVVAPLMLGLAGVLRRHRAHHDSCAMVRTIVRAKLAASSALLCALIQEPFPFRSAFRASRSRCSRARRTPRAKDGRGAGGVAL